MRPDDTDSAVLAAALGRDVATVPDLLWARVRATPEQVAMWDWHEGAGWRSLTWRVVGDAVRAATAGLRELGLQPGDRIGILARSCPRWDFAQFAVLALGGVVVGLDSHDTQPRLAEIAARCGLKGVVAQDEATVAKIGATARAALRFEVVLSADSPGRAVAFDHLGTQAGVTPDEAPSLARPRDAALVIFTSGTTGQPKGIEYAHDQVCQAVGSILQAFSDIGPGARLACWLPLSNLFQRMINLCAVGRGAQTYYVEDPRSIMQQLPGIAPHLLIGVPRFFEKLHAGILESIEAMPPTRRRLAHWAIAAGERRAAAQRGGSTLGMADRWAAALADRLVLQRIRGVLGGEIRFLISGSAPMAPWLLERFQGLGLLVLEAYGLSENIVPVAINRPGHYRFGTVGLPPASTEIRLAPDGELQLRGPGVFTGYLGETGPAPSIDSDGFLASGDYARIDADGFVTLLGRKSEIFKTSTGRRIAPASIEGRIRQIASVEHAVVFGANRPFPVAVVALTPTASGATPDPETLAARFRAELARVLADLPDYQRPGAALLSTRAFTIEAGELTPNLKVRRVPVAAGYAAGIDALYAAATRATALPWVLTADDGAILMST